MRKWFFRSINVFDAVVICSSIRECHARSTWHDDIIDLTLHRLVIIQYHDVITTWNIGARLRGIDWSALYARGRSSDISLAWNIPYDDSTSSSEYENNSSGLVSGETRWNSLAGIARAARVRFPQTSTTIPVTLASTWNLVSVWPLRLVLCSNLFYRTERTVIINSPSTYTPSVNLRYLPRILK